LSSRLHTQRPSGCLDKPRDDGNAWRREGGREGGREGEGKSGSASSEIKKLEREEREAGREGGREGGRDGRTIQGLERHPANVDVLPI